MSDDPNIRPHFIPCVIIEGEPLHIRRDDRGALIARVGDEIIATAYDREVFTNAIAAWVRVRLTKLDWFRYSGKQQPMIDPTTGQPWKTLAALERYTKGKK